MTTETSPICFFLLRGLSREVRHWGDFCNLLAQSRSNFRVFPLEIPGAGKRRAERSPTSMADYVVFLRSQYLQHTQTNQINVVLGLSFGGMIAARWIYEFSTDFHGAILLNTSGRPSPLYQRLKLSAAATLLGAVLSNDTYTKEKKIADLICHLTDNESLARKWQFIADSAPVSRSNFLRQLYAAATFSLPEKTSIPTLLLGSTNDRLVATACSRKIADTWNVELITHPSAGHDLTTDDADWCISKILSWIPQLHP